jgi:hypothetical protein
MCMNELNSIHEIYHRYCSASSQAPPFARMLTIYIQESSDGSAAFNTTKPVKGFHKTIHDRVNAATKFIKETEWTAGEIVCDSMTNEALERYEAHPERLLIVQNGRIVHDGGKGPIIMLRYDPQGKIISYQLFFLD